MKYIVFKYNSKSATYISGSLDPSPVGVRNLGIFFKGALAEVCETIFNISQLSDTLYFVGFEDNTEGGDLVQDIITRLSSTEDKSITPEELAGLLRNLKKASVLVRLDSPIPIHKNIIPATHVCKVDPSHDNTKVIQNAYGDYLCEDCWINYLHSDDRKGLVEYVISIGKGLSSMSLIPVDAINSITEIWESERDNLITLTESEKSTIEETWVALTT